MVQFNKYADKTAGGIETHSTPFDSAEFDAPNWATHIREWGKSPGGVIVPAQFDEYGNKKVAVSGSDVLNHGNKNVATAGTAVQIDSQPCKEVTIIAKRKNRGLIYIGGSTVSSSSFGADLAARDSITLKVSNVNLIYIDADNSGEGVTYIAI